MGNAIDLKGLTFGRLTVIERAANSKQSKARWMCLCECGKMKVVDSYYLMTGHTRSCGCLRNDTKNIKHGKSSESIYHVWQTMKRRCFCPTNKKYKNYGARGIGMCDEWRKSFETFYEWAQNNGYEAGLTIERVDVNEGYFPGNCTWIRLEAQATNKTNNKMITYNGVTLCLQQWQRKTGIRRETISHRLKMGWSVERALTEPIHKFEKPNTA